MHFDYTNFDKLLSYEIPKNYDFETDIFQKGFGVTDNWLCLLLAHDLLVIFEVTCYMHK